MRKLLCFFAALMLLFSGVVVEASGRNTSTRNQTQQQRDRASSRTNTSREKARNTKNGRKNDMRKKADKRFNQQWSGQD